MTPHWTKAVLLCMIVMVTITTQSTVPHDKLLTTNSHVTHDPIHGDENHTHTPHMHDGHGNESDHDAHSGGEHVGIHVASWNFEYVRQPLIIAIFLIVTAICKLGFHHTDFLSSIVPESCLLIIMGTVVGAILHFTHVDKNLSHMSPALFFLFLLPPIILESAYSLHDRVFFDNLGTVLLYAVLGTILNCFLLGPLLYGLAICGGMGPISIRFIQCLVFSSLIVAVDPVAVLAIFQEIGVNNVLYFLVFGESLLNDAVTVVLYNMMKTFQKMKTIAVSQVFLGVAAFFTVSLGGLTIGLLFGVVTAFLTKFTGNVRVVEPLALFALAYASYLTAELFHFSGIISIIACGLVQAQYAFHNISHKSYTTVTYFSKVTSTTCDCVIFMFLGLALVREDHVWHTGFILWAIILCLVIRFIVVYALTFIVNRVDRIRMIDTEEQFIMAYGGLRGAVAFSLVSMLDEKMEHQNLFETATLAVIIFTVFVQGITIKPLVKLLRIRRSEKQTLSIYEEINCHVTDHVMAGVEEVLGYYGSNFIRELLDYYDDKYLKNWLQKNPQKKDDMIMELYQRIALQQHYDNVAGSGLASRYASSLQLYQVQQPSDEEEEEDLPFEDTFAEMAQNPELVDRTLDLHNRRKSSAKILLKEEPEVIDNPTVNDVRKWLVPNPSKETYHRKYDKNLKNEDNNDLLHHLHDKQLRNDRYRRSMSLFYSPSASGYSSPRHSNVDLAGILAFRKNMGLGVIPERESLSAENVADPNRSPRKRAQSVGIKPMHIPHAQIPEIERKAKLRKNKPDLKKAQTIDVAGDETVSPPQSSPERTAALPAKKRHRYKRGRSLSSLRRRMMSQDAPQLDQVREGTPLMANQSPEPDESAPRGLDDIPENGSGKNGDENDKARIQNGTSDQPDTIVPMEAKAESPDTSKTESEEVSIPMDDFNGSPSEAESPSIDTSPRTPLIERHNRETKSLQKAAKRSLSRQKSLEGDVHTPVEDNSKTEEVV